jgi:hypothetical protein
MPANFETKISRIGTAVVNGLQGVIKRVEFIVVGTDSGQTFELPQSVDLPDPDAVSFKALPSILPADVIGWVERHFPNMQAVKDHIQFVLDREVAKAALVDTPLPWAPPAAQVDTSTTAGTAAAPVAQPAPVADPAAAPTATPAVAAAATPAAAPAA